MACLSETLFEITDNLAYLSEYVDNLMETFVFYNLDNNCSRTVSFVCGV